MTTFTGTGSGIDVIRANTLAVALEFYAKTGMKVNRSYTTTRMIQVAREITAHTGARFGARDYRGAARALRAWIAVHAPAAVALGEIK